MIERIKNILLKPREEWPRIDAEPMTESGILTGWVLPLAAIGPVASLIGGQVFGYGAFGITYKPPIMFALVSAILGFVLAVAAVWIVAKIVDALAPSFGGTKNPVSAMKVVAFAYTASFVGGVFGIIPALAIIGALIGLYGFYLLYLGLPVLMKAPQDKAIGYTVVTVLCAIVASFVVGLIAAAIAGAVAAPTMMMNPGAPAVVGEVTVPGVGSVDLAKMEAATKQLEAAAAQQQAAVAGATTAGAVTPVDPNALAALLPASAAGWSRTSIESSGASAAGVGGAKAEGEYALGQDTARLSVTDLGSMGALAALGSAFNVQSNKTTSDGYERTSTTDGRMTSEKWANGSRHGEYTTVVGNRFVVEVSGNAQNIDQLKALVGSVDLGRVATLAK